MMVILHDKIGGVYSGFFLDESKDCVMYDGDKAFCKDDIITVNGFTGDIILGAVKTIPKGFKFVYC